MLDAAVDLITFMQAIHSGSTIGQEEMSPVCNWTSAGTRKSDKACLETCILELLAIKPVQIAASVHMVLILSLVH